MGELITQPIIEAIKAQIATLATLDDETRMDAINELRMALHDISPMKREPVDCVLWVRGESVVANDYNPNKVAPPEMRLLQLSIQQDGYTQPIVTMPGEAGQNEVIDGFHRNRCGKEVGAIRKRVMGRLPIVRINTERTAKEDRIAATIRHNRARGKHQVDAMAEIVADLVKRNWTAEKIAKELGMDADEVLRLKQITGLAELFADKEFSEAWEVAA
jgi:ParB-like chromosome segregation protein Spo0J